MQIESLQLQPIYRCELVLKGKGWFRTCMCFTALLCCISSASQSVMFVERSWWRPHWCHILQIQSYSFENMLMLTQTRHQTHWAWGCRLADAGLRTFRWTLVPDSSLVTFLNHLCPEIQLRDPSWARLDLQLHNHSFPACSVLYLYV